MIVGKITAKSQTTVPRAVRMALGLTPGDEVAWIIEDGRAVMVRVPVEDNSPVPDFSMFTEWADELDSVYDNL